MSPKSPPTPFEVVVRSDALSKGWLDGTASTILRGDHLITALSQLSALMTELPQPDENPHWEIEELKLIAEINAEGGLRFLGAVNVGAVGGIEITLKRK